MSKIPGGNSARINSRRGTRGKGKEGRRYDNGIDTRHFGIRFLYKEYATAHAMNEGLVDYRTDYSWTTQRVAGFAARGGTVARFGRSLGRSLSIEVARSGHLIASIGQPISWSIGQHRLSAVGQLLQSRQSVVITISIQDAVRGGKTCTVNGFSVHQPLSPDIYLVCFSM